MFRTRYRALWRLAPLLILFAPGMARAQCPEIPPDPLPPSISPPGGLFHTVPVAVTISGEDGYRLMYSTDGSTPTNLYTEPLQLTRTTTVNARSGCYETTSGVWYYSEIVTAEFTIQAAAPVFSPTSGSYALGTTIQLSSATPDANIRYRLDGETPSDTDPEVPSDGMLIVGGFTVTARAFYRFMDPSDVTTATYTMGGAYAAGSMAGGLAHSVALTPDGAIWTWGSNGRRQLGYGERWRENPFTFASEGELVVQSAASPQRKSVTGLRVVAAGDDFNVALREDGSVWTWGSNGSGELGRTTCAVDYPSSSFCVRPGPVAGLTDAVAVSAGALHALALSATGTISAWGDNSNGQLGDGTTTGRSTPQPVSGLAEVVAVAAGAWHNLALRADGTVWAWGDNWAGQIGDGTGVDRYTPVQVATLTDVRAVAAGAFHSLAIGANGTLWTWGQNSSGQLGDGTTHFRTTPTAVLTNVIAAAAGRSHTVAIKSDGTLWAWGDNTAGQLGDGTFTTRLTPTLVPGVPSMRAVAASAHTLTVGTDGSGWVWGRNTDGQVGDGTTTDRAVPAQIFPPGTFDGCSLAEVTPESLLVPNTAGSHTFAVTTAWDCTWGATSDSSWAQPGAGGTGSGSVAVAVDVNPSAPRTALLTIAGQPVTLSQEGYAIVPPMNEEISYFHTDAIGSVRMITDAAGTVVARYDYLPFGAEWTTSFSSIANSVKFTGQERDAETAFAGWLAHDYFGARSYQNQTGRFIRPDDPGFADPFVPQTTNLYAYAYNNPFKFVDPTGHQGDCVGVYDQKSNNCLGDLGFGRFLEFGEQYFWSAFQFFRNNVAEQARLQHVLSECTRSGAYSADCRQIQQDQLSAMIPLGATLRGVGTLVIGRTKDLLRLAPGERSLLSRLTPSLGSPRGNWKRNAGVLRDEMRRGLPIRDASPGLGGPFLNAERALLRSRGWRFDPATNYWLPPGR